MAIKKNVEYNNDTIASYWEKVLTGPVLDRYFSWKLQINKERHLFTALQKFGLMQHESKRMIKKWMHAMPFFKF